MKYSSKTYTPIFRVASGESIHVALAAIDRQANYEETDIPFEAIAAVGGLDWAINRGDASVHWFYRKAPPGKLGRIFAAALNKVKSPSIDNFYQFFVFRAMRG